jgi:Zn finger protein HypA/HybF involved in hydrogenase expression
MAVINSGVLTTTVNGKTVELTGPNAHPFKCAACDSCFRHHRFAARCHEVGSQDLRVDLGEAPIFRAYDHEWELDQIEADNRHWETEWAKHHFECSCGERFKYLVSAVECRKCRTYTDEGFCTEVLDLETGQVVWSLNVQSRRE